MGLFNRKQATTIELAPVEPKYSAVRRERKFAFIAEPVEYFTVVDADGQEVTDLADNGPRAVSFSRMSQAQRYAQSLNS